MASNSPDTSRKPPPTARFVKAMGRGLHEHFDEAAEREVPGEFLQTLKQADRRRLLKPRDSTEKH